MASPGATAPMHDPNAAGFRGTVDIPGRDGLAHPHSPGFVEAVARPAATQLALLAPPRPPAQTSMLSALGLDEAELLLISQPVPPVRA